MSVIAGGRTAEYFCLEVIGQVTQGCSLTRMPSLAFAYPSPPPRSFLFFFLLPLFSFSSYRISVVILLSDFRCNHSQNLNQPQSERCVSTIEMRSIVATRNGAP